MRDALTYFGGLFVTSALVWLACVPLGPDSTPGDIPLGQIFWWYWIVPLPYLFAWFLLVVPSVPRALAAVAAVAAANLVITAAGLLVGVFSFTLLALPAMVVAGRVLGFVVALAHVRAVAWAGWKAWRRIHVVGGNVAGFGLAFALIAVMVNTKERPPAYGDWIAFGAASALGFLFHAISARRQLHADGSAIAPPARMAALLGIAYVVASLEIWSAGYRTLAWPLHLQEAAEAVSASRKAGRAPLDLPVKEVP